MKLRENVKHELSEVERKKEIKNLVTKIKKKCKKVKLFNYAFGEGEDDDSDEEGEDMKKIFKEFSKFSKFFSTQMIVCCSETTVKSTVHCTST